MKAEKKGVGDQETTYTKGQEDKKTAHLEAIIMRQLESRRLTTGRSPILSTHEHVNGTMRGGVAGEDRPDIWNLEQHCGPDELEDPICSYPRTSNKAS